MTTSDDRPRKRPSGDAWQEAQRDVSDRNDLARKAGREERAAHEKQVAAFKRAERKRGEIYR
jgi:hypothetical protein